MDGRSCYRYGIGLTLTIWSPAEIDRWTILDYVGGIADTLDGSHGPSFTYLPIVYEDDCQITRIDFDFLPADHEEYQLKIDFL